jgi:phosphoribosylformimino-5-aminoimidazole carboxamide ribotide isomerase
MDIVPVLDLMGGVVVHARRGVRKDYRPIVSRLCRGSDPLAIAGALIAAHGFHTLYVADLDAIAGAAPHIAVVAALLRRHAGVGLWIDHGARADYRRQLAAWRDRIAWVYGSESLKDARRLGSRARGATQTPILSLDWRGGRLLGPARLLAAHAGWPERVIALDLDRVGSGRGPDLDLLRRLVALAPAHRFYAGGGVRDARDLDALRRAGAAGALVATALHDGRLDAAALRAYGAGGR